MEARRGYYRGFERFMRFWTKRGPQGPEPPFYTSGGNGRYPWFIGVFSLSYPPRVGYSCPEGGYSRPGRAAPGAIPYGLCQKCRKVRMLPVYTFDHGIIVFDILEVLVHGCFLCRVSLTFQACFRQGMVYSQGDIPCRPLGGSHLSAH